MVNSNRFAGVAFTLVLAATSLLVSSGPVGADGNGPVIYEEYFYDAQGSLVTYRGPVYGPVPDQAELGRQTWTWTWNYSGGIRFLMARSGPAGHAEAWTYNGIMPVLHSQQGGLRTESYAYDAQGYLSQIVVASGSSQLTTTYSNTYANGCLLLDRTNPRGKAERYRFDALGRLITEVGPANSLADILALEQQGKVRARAYDVAGNLVSSTDELGATTTHTYDSLGNRISTTDANGRITSFTYDGFGRVTSRALPGVPPGSYTDTYYYNPDGTLRARGRLSATGTMLYYGYGYDSHGTCSYVVGPAFSLAQVYTYVQEGLNCTKLVVSFVNDDLGRTESAAWASGVSQSFSYDARNNLLSSASSASGTAQFGYDDFSRTTWGRSAGGVAFRMEYDPLGRCTKYVGPWRDSNSNALEDDADTAIATVYQHDVADNVTWVKEGSREPVTRTYDHTLCLTATAGTASHVCTYDAVGNLASLTTPGGTVWTYSRDAVGRCTSVKCGPGTAEEIREDYAYDAGGRMTLVSSFPVSGQSSPVLTRAFSYNAIGRVQQITERDGSVTTYEYDGAGNLISDGPSTGLRTVRQLDSEGDLQARTYRGAPTLAFERDSMGRLTSVTEGEQRTWTMSHDSLGRLSTEVYPGGRTLVHGYDGLSRPVTTTVDGTYTQTRTYDARGRVSAFSDGSSSVSATWNAYGDLTSTTDEAGRTIAYSFDAYGALATETHPDGTLYSYTYNNDRALASIQRTVGAVTTEVTGLSYDNLGRVREKTLSNGYVQRYAYDGMGQRSSIELRDTTGTLVDRELITRDALARVIQVDHLNGDTRTFEYDGDGRLIEAVRTGGVAYSHAYSYDSNGRLLSELRGSEETTYEYDALGQLISRTTPAGEDEYEYDEEGKLVGRTGVSGSLEISYNVRGLPASVTVGSNTSEFSYDVRGYRKSKTSGGTTRNYAYDIEGTRIGTYSSTTLLESTFALSREHREFVVRGADTFAITRDALDDVAGIRDASGGATSTYAFAPFGEVVASTGATWNDVGFQDLPFDAELGLYNNGGRLYSADERIFASADPVRVSKPLSPYGRTDHDPVNFLDPTGFCRVGKVSFKDNPLPSIPSMTTAGHTEAEIKIEIDPEKDIEFRNQPNQYILPCYKGIEDLAVVYFSGNAEVTITMTAAKEGTHEKEGGWKIVVSKEASESVRWHEKGHGILQQAFYEQYLAAGLVSLAGIRSGSPIQDPKTAKAEAHAKWKAKRDELISKAKAAQSQASGERKASGRTLGIAEGTVLSSGERLHGIMKNHGSGATTDPVAKTVTLQDSGGFEQNNITDAGVDPKSYDNSYFKNLKEDTAWKGRTMAEKDGWGKSPCECGHTPDQPPIKK